jgi:nickel-dependent lactate racemase
VTQVALPYGRGSLLLTVPEEAVILEPRYLPSLPDEVAAIREALAHPLAGPPLVVPAGARVGISVCDVTRAFPARRVLPPLLEALGGVEVSLFVATGTHRPCTPAELEAMFGEEVLARCQVVQHDAFACERHTALGRVPGSEVPALIETAFLEQDVRIVTGFIEPHFFAGFSGGPKMVAPGLAALETVLELHSAARIASPQATWGVTVGNPIHDAIRTIAERAGIAFSLDVTLNKDHGITGVFAGELATAHACGCAFARETAMVPVAAPFDVVVTTNSGYPLDQNLYQSVKGMSAAAQIVRPGGAILIASACEDGLPAHGRYAEHLASARSPEAFLARLADPTFRAHDQWQAQVQALIQQRAEVFLKTDGIPPDEVRRAWLEPVDDLAAALADLQRRYGHRVAILPQGPQTIPYLVS